MSKYDSKYVDFASGSDLTGDGTKLNPWQSITHANWKRRGGGFNNIDGVIGFAKIFNNIANTDNIKVEITLHEFVKKDCLIVGKWGLSGSDCWQIRLDSNGLFTVDVSGDGTTTHLSYRNKDELKPSDIVGFSFVGGVLTLFKNGISVGVDKLIDTGTVSINSSTLGTVFSDYDKFGSPKFVGIMSDFIVTDTTTGNQVVNIDFAIPATPSASTNNTIIDITGNGYDLDCDGAGYPMSGCEKDDIYDKKAQLNEVDMKVDFGSGDTLKPTNNIDISFGIEDITKGDIIGKWGVDKGYQLSCYQGQLVITLSSDNETVTYKAVSINSLPNGTDVGVTVRFVLYNGRPTVYFDDVLQSFDIVLDLNVNEVSETTRGLIAGENDEFYEAELDVLNGGILENVSASQASQFPSGYPPTFTRASTRTVEDCFSETVLIDDNVAPIKGARYTGDGGKFNGVDSYLDCGNPNELQLTDNIQAESTIASIGGSGFRVFLSKLSFTGSQRSWYMSINSSSKFEVSVEPNGDFSQKKTYSTISNVSVGETLKFTFVFGVLKLFINDVEQSVTKTNDDTFTTIFNSTSPIVAGAINVTATPSSYFNGTISDVKITDLSTNTVVLDMPLKEDFKDHSEFEHPVINKKVVFDNTVINRTYADGSLIPVDKYDYVRDEFDNITKTLVSEGIYKGYSPNPQGTNLILNSDTPADQSVTTVISSKYTLSVKVGSATVLTQTATPNNPVTVTATGTSTPITFSVDCEKAQFELGTIATSYIPTYGTTVTRVADGLNYDGTVINNTNGAVEIDLNLSSIPSTGGFYNIIGADASYILKVDDSGDIVFNDGTTESSSGLTISEGTSRIWLTWSNSTANIYLNGVKSADLPYDGTLAPTNMYIGNDSTGNQSDAYFENVKVYDKVIPQEFIVKDN